MPKPGRGVVPMTSIVGSSRTSAGFSATPANDVWTLAKIPQSATSFAPRRGENGCAMRRPPCYDLAIRAASLLSFRQPDDHAVVREGYRRLLDQNANIEIVGRMTQKTVANHQSSRSNRSS